MHRCTKRIDAVRLPGGQGAAAIDATSRSAPPMCGFSSVAILRRVVFWRKTRVLRCHVAFEHSPLQRVAGAVGWKQRFENRVLVGQNQPLGRRECQPCVSVQEHLHRSPPGNARADSSGLSNILALLE
jgi:hypothetical protein